MKIIMHSNAPWAATGYGQQTALFAPRFRDLGHDVAISAFYGLEGSMLDWNGINVYPTDFTRFGKSMLRYYVGHHANDECNPRDVLVLTLMDVWALSDPSLSDLRLASWTPIDHYPMPPRARQFFDITGARPIAMSKFGEASMIEAGLDPLYAPHAIDTSIFYPRTDARLDVRRGLGLPEDAFVVGMVANNKGTAPPRKAFPQVFQAFSLFQKMHPEAVLYMHTDMFGTDSGIHLVALAEICDIPKSALISCDQLNYFLGLPPELMANVYSAFDVLMNPSYGEGFGIPIIEAQACGVPVIVNDWTAMPELCGAGWKVEGDTFYDPPHGSFYMCPSVHEIVEKLEMAFEARNDQQLRQQAVDFAQQYDVGVVMTEWEHIFEELEQPREVGPVEFERIKA